LILRAQTPFIITVTFQIQIESGPLIVQVK
jgi:hypothetical protein